MGDGHVHANDNGVPDRVTHHMQNRKLACTSACWHGSTKHAAQWFQGVSLKFSVPDTYANACVAQQHHASPTYLQGGDSSMAFAEAGVIGGLPKREDHGDQTPDGKGRCAVDSEPAHAKHSLYQVCHPVRMSMYKRTCTYHSCKGWCTRHVLRYSGAMQA